MVFVFLVRHLLRMPSQKIWSKFTYEDYKVNKRCFKRFVEHDKLIMKRSRKFRKLPKTHTVKSKKKSRSEKASCVSFSEESPMKRRCVLGDSTTSEEDTK